MFVVDAAKPGAIGYVVKDGEGKRCREIEDHANTPTQLIKIHFGIIDICSVNKNGSCMARPRNEIPETIETFQKCCFPTPCRTKNGEDLFGLNLKANVPEGFIRVVVDAEILNDDFALLKHDSPL